MTEEYEWRELRLSVVDALHKEDCAVADLTSAYDPECADAWYRPREEGGEGLSRAYDIASAIECAVEARTHWVWCVVWLAEIARRP